MRRQGFTLIEVVVVCALLGMFAALVFPNVVAMKAGRERRQAYDDVLRLAQMGREAAIQSGRAYSLTLNDNGTTVVLSRDQDAQPSRGEQNGNSSTEEQTPEPQLPTGVIVGSYPTATRPSGGAGISDDASGSSVSLPSGVQIGEIVLDGKPSTSSDFKLHFYPDGRSEGGGFEMIEGSTTRSLTVDRNGLARLQEAELPAATENKWEAGQYEQRASS